MMNPPVRSTYQIKLYSILLLVLSVTIFLTSVDTDYLTADIKADLDQDERSIVLVDISHGYEVYIPAAASVMSGFLEETGDFDVRSTEMKTPITTAILTDVDVFMIVCPDPTFQYTADEIEALKSFMSNGGSILFVGEPQIWKVTGDPGMESSELNRVIEDLGFPISFAEGLPYYCKTDLQGNLPDHPLMYNLSSLFMTTAPLQITNYTNFEVLAQGTQSSETYDSLAVFDNSTHRAAFIGARDVFFEHRKYRDGGYPDDQTYVDDGRGDAHYQFQYNMMNWLSHRSPNALGEYLPIKVYTEYDSQIDPVSLRSMDYYQGIFHFHTEKSDVNAPLSDLVDVFEDLGHEWVAPTDYNTVAGGPALRTQVNKEGSDIVVIDGQEATGLGQYHTTGLFKPDNATDIFGVLDPYERIELFHNQSSPCYLAHPSWLFYPEDTDRIWDHDVYPFDGYEVINTGYLQGNGNLAEHPFYGAPDSHSADYWDIGTVWNYVFSAEKPSEDPNWLKNAISERRLVIYSHLGDYYFGDQLVVDELIGRLSGEINMTTPTTTTSATSSEATSQSSTSSTDSTSSSSTDEPPVNATPSITMSLVLVSLFFLYYRRKAKRN